MNDMRKLMEAVAQFEDDGDVESKHRSDEEFYSDIMKLIDEAQQALEAGGFEDVVDQALQDIGNMVSLRASGRPYAPIHEDDGVRYDPQPGDDEPLNIDVYEVGPIKVKQQDGEITLSHGHGENIFLSQAEWQTFLEEVFGELGE